MKRLNPRFSVFIILILFISENLMASAPDSEFNLTEIAEGVYLHSGIHVTFDHPQHDDIANIGFIIGENCIAVIDTGGSVNIADQLKQAIRSVSDKPVCYVINTHVHFDHVLGNAVFKTDKTEFVGHANLAEAMESNREFFLTEYATDLGKYANDEGIISPTILVEKTLQLDLGGRSLELQSHPSAHSGADLTVLDKKTNTLWLSDLLFVERIPSFDGSLKGWLGVIDELETQHYDRVVPGHGPVVEWPEGIQAEKTYLNFLLTNIRNKIEEGAFMEDIVSETGKEEKLQWQLHEQHHKRNVTKAFSELEWE